MSLQEPGLLELSITENCNLRCRYCYAHGGEKADQMSFETALRAIDVMQRSFSSFKIQFTGGEPLLNLALIEKTVDYLDESGLNVPCQVQTNATLITSDIADRLKGLNIGIGVSLDGPPQVNDALRPLFDSRSAANKGSTTATLKGISALRDEGITTGVTTVLSRFNVEHLFKLVDILSFFGNVDGIAIDYLRPVGRGDQSMQADPDTAVKGIEDAILRSYHIAKLSGRTIKFRELDRMKLALSSKTKRRHHCYFDACRSLVVKPDGRSYVCPSLTDPQFMIGDIAKHSFEVGLEDRMIETRRLVNDPPKCNSCMDRSLCGGPCLAHHVMVSNLNIECNVKKVFMKHARSGIGNQKY